MPGTRAIALGLGTIAVLATGWQFSCSARKQVQSKKLPLPQAGLPSGYSPSQVREPRGISAVHPTRGDQTPSFAQEDLLNFVQRHSIPKVTKIEPNPTVSRIDCSQTAKTVAAVLRGKTTGLPDATPVCYVELQGEFAISAPPSKRGSQQRRVLFNRSFEVFDARTGNLILSGGFIHPPAKPQ
jgi:hypothetical protein